MASIKIAAQRLQTFRIQKVRHSLDRTAEYPPAIQMLDFATITMFSINKSQATSTQIGGIAGRSPHTLHIGCIGRIHRKTFFDYSYLRHSVLQ